MCITNRSERSHLHHRWKLIYLHRAIVLPMMEDWSKHSAKKLTRKWRNLFQIQHTNSTNELAPRSNRWSLVNLGNVTGNNRIRVARISRIFNSVKLEQATAMIFCNTFTNDYRPKFPGRNSNKVSLRYNSFKLINIVNPSHNLEKYWRYVLSQSSR